MKEDPYSALIGMMQTAGRPSGPTIPIHLRLGTVLSPLPLRLDVAGTIQEAEHVYISHRLTQEHQELLRLDCGDVTETFLFSSSCPHTENPHGVHRDDPSKTSAGTLKTPRCTATQAKPVLEKGDQVLLLTEDDQIFFLIDKVVKAS